MSQTIREEIKEGRDMIEYGQEEDSVKFFENLIEKHPDSAEVNLYAGMTYDNLAQEQKAIPLYKKALEIGVDDKEEMRNCLVSLASSFRVEGDSNKSLKTLEKAKTEFPNDPVVSSFLALTLCELDQAERAVAELGLALLRESENPDLSDFNFGEPLRRYFSDLKA